MAEARVAQPLDRRRGPDDVVVPQGDDGCQWPGEGGDLTLDDLGTPLHEVTFCVVDLETTGASARTCEITEVGAARFRGGERLGTFQTLVEPGTPIAPAVSALTGITDAMVHDAPTPSQVLPTLLEFVGGAVLVGHNLRFDVGFLDAALLADERAPVGLWAVDTLALARRLLGDEVPDHRLGTLADHLGLDHRPTHRALDDVLATADLLHARDIDALDALLAPTGNDVDDGAAASLPIAALQALPAAKRARALRAWTRALGLPPLPGSGIDAIDGLLAARDFFTGPAAKRALLTSAHRRLDRLLRLLAVLGHGSPRPASVATHMPFSVAGCRRASDARCHDWAPDFRKPPGRPMRRPILLGTSVAQEASIPGAFSGRSRCVTSMQAKETQ